MDFRKEKEYIAVEGNDPPIRFVVIKIKTAEDKSFKEISYKHNEKVVTFKNTEVDHITFIEPIDNVSFFTMYVNWMNHLRPGVHQELVFADKVKESIKQSLITRSYVKEGTGKFNEYDFNLLEKMFPSLDLNLISLGS